MAWLEALDDDHKATALGTWLAEGWCFLVAAGVVVGPGVGRWHAEKMACESQVPGLAAVGEKAVVADAVSVYS